MNECDLPLRIFINHNRNHNLQYAICNITMTKIYFISITNSNQPKSLYTIKIII